MASPSTSAAIALVAVVLVESLEADVVVVAAVTFEPDKDLASASARTRSFVRAFALRIIIFCVSRFVGACW